MKVTYRDKRTKRKQIIFQITVSKIDIQKRIGTN